MSDPCPRCSKPIEVSITSDGRIVKVRHPKPAAECMMVIDDDIRETAPDVIAISFFEGDVDE